jgi:hypothetical protein
MSVVEGIQESQGQLRSSRNEIHYLRFRTRIVMKEITNQDVEFASRQSLHELGPDWSVNWRSS